VTVNLTAKRVAKLLSRGEPGNHYDGQGLRLEIRGKNAASQHIGQRRPSSLCGVAVPGEYP
jgi:hypothetical protein